MSYLEQAETDFCANMLCWQREGGGVLTAFEAVCVCERLQRLGGNAFEKPAAEPKPVIASAIPLGLSFKHTHTRTE